MTHYKKKARGRARQGGREGKEGGQEEGETEENGRRKSKRRRKEDGEGEEGRRERKRRRRKTRYRNKNLRHASTPQEILKSARKSIRAHQAQPGDTSGDCTGGRTCRARPRSSRGPGYGSRLPNSVVWQTPASAADQPPGACPDLRAHIRSPRSAQRRTRRRPRQSDYMHQLSTDVAAHRPMAHRLS